MPTPSSIEAEAGVLGSIMVDVRVLSAAVQLGICPNSFYHPAHITIWTAITELERVGSPIDLMTVGQYLKDRDQLEAVGGPFALSEMFRFPTAAKWKDYAKIVKEKERRRGLISSAARLAAASEESLDMQEVEQIAQSIGLESAKSMVSGSQVQHIKHPVMEFLDNVEKAQLGTDTRLRLKVGLPNLEQLTHGMPPGTHMVIGAQTSVGKTALALQFAWNVAYVQQKPVLFISLEMTAEKLAGRIAATASGISLGKLYAQKPELSERDFDDIHKGITKIGASELYVWTPSDTPTAAQVAAMMRMQKIQKPELALVVVDYIQLLAATGKDDNRERQVANMSNTLMRASVGLNVTTVVLSQLNDDGMLRESRAVGHDARIVATLTRPKSKSKIPEKDNGERTLYLDKNSEGQSGIPIELHFDGPHQTFREVYED